MFKLTIKTTDQHRSTVFIVNFEHISRLLLVFLLLNLNTQMLVEIRRLVRSVNILCSGSLHQCQLTSLWCLYYWIWKYLHIRVALLLLTVKFTFWLLFTFTMFTLARLNTDWLQNLKFLNFFSAFFRYPSLSVSKKCSVFFWKFWLALFLCYLRFEIRLFADITTLHCVITDKFSVPSSFSFILIFSFQQNLFHERFCKFFVDGN